MAPDAKPLTRRARLGYALRLWWNPFYDPDGSRRAAAIAAVAADPPPGLGTQWALKNWTPDVPLAIKLTMYFTGGALTATQERWLRAMR